MIRLGADDRMLEISIVEVHPAIPGEYAGGDVKIEVSVRHGSFAGAAVCWVMPEGWRRFIVQLRRLEQDRRGEAVLASITEDELRVRFFALDRAGHMAVEGELKSWFLSTHEPRTAALRFPAIEFDPTLLPELLRELGSAVPESLR